MLLGKNHRTIILPRLILSTADRVTHELDLIFLHLFDNCQIFTAETRIDNSPLLRQWRGIVIDQILDLVHAVVLEYTLRRIFDGPECGFVHGHDLGGESERGVGHHQQVVNAGFQKVDQVHVFEHGFLVFGQFLGK